MTRRVLILGSTGSIGTQTVGAIEALHAAADAGLCDRRFEIVGLAAGSKGPALAEQAAKLGVRELAIGDPAADLHGAPQGANIRRGPDAAEALVREVEADLVVAAIVGVAGLPSTLAAVELGRDVALANKETLVAAGPLVVKAARASGSRLFPVDSEHAAAWQCLASLPGCAPHCPLESPPPSLRRLIITASGGAFRTRDAKSVYHATPDEALAHPTWNMGAKVTIDCATLTNKALELIEAHWLFALPAKQIDAIIHPQSTVHAIAELADGSMLAQMAAPDMRLPIAQALCAGSVPPTLGLGNAPRGLDLTALGAMTFEEPDLDRFPALAQAHRVMNAGGTAGAAFNAANEAAVGLFLDRRIPFGRIAELSIAALDAHPVRAITDLSDVRAADEEARAFVAERSLSAAGGR